MRIKNTSNFSSDMIREIIAFVKPNKVTNFDCWVKKSQHGFAGRAYCSGCSYHGRWCPYIVVRIGENKYPYTIHKNQKKGYMEITLYSAEELLVSVIAHELRHLWQKKVPRGWRVWGARGQFSERDADAYAIHMVREWRRR